MLFLLLVRLLIIGPAAERLFGSVYSQNRIITRDAGFKFRCRSVFAAAALGASSLSAQTGIEHQTSVLVHPLGGGGVRGLSAGRCGDE